MGWNLQGLNSIACLMIFAAAIFSTYKNIWLFEFVCDMRFAKIKKHEKKKLPFFIKKIGYISRNFFFLQNESMFLKTSKFILIASKYYNYPINHGILVEMKCFLD